MRKRGETEDKRIGGKNLEERKNHRKTRGRKEGTHRGRGNDKDAENQKVSKTNQETKKLQRYG